MDSSVVALRRALESGGDATADGGRTGTCAVCGRPLSTPDGAVVEVTVPTAGDGDDADGRICPSCYEYVVGELGIAPVRVFKSGPRRRVVLPGATGDS